VDGPLGRVILPSFVLTIWVLFGVWLAKGDWTGLNWLLLAVTAAITAIVFWEFASVFSFGYALCLVVSPALVLAVRGITTASVVVCGLLIVFGLRLLLFSLRRRHAASAATMQEHMKRANSAVPTPLKVVVFVFVTTLQTFEVMPAYVVGTDGRTTPWLWVGGALMLVGLVVETVADEQKHRAKEAAPATFVRTGLWARTRHPNYTGEIVFQVGLAAVALGSVTGWWQLLAVVVSPAYIVVLMFFSANGGDAKMAARYGEDPEWTAYRAGSGSLLPVGR